MDSSGNVWERDALGSRGRRLMIAGMCTNNPRNLLLSCVHFKLSESLEKQLAASLAASRNICGLGVQKSIMQPSVDPDKLANRWGISLDAAKRTVRQTTQRGIRSVLHPTLSRRFRTNDRQMRYRQLQHDLYTDTLEAPVKSR